MEHDVLYEKIVVLHIFVVQFGHEPYQSPQNFSLFLQNLQTLDNCQNNYNQLEFVFNTFKGTTIINYKKFKPIWRTTIVN